MTPFVDFDRQANLTAGLIDGRRHRDAHGVVAVAEVLALHRAAGGFEDCRLEDRSGRHAERADDLFGRSRRRAIDHEPGDRVLPALVDVHRQLGGLPREDRCLNLDDGFEISEQAILLLDCRLQDGWVVPHRRIQALSAHGGMERGRRNRLLTRKDDLPIREASAWFDSDRDLLDRRVWFRHDGCLDVCTEIPVSRQLRSCQ